MNQESGRSKHSGSASETAIADVSDAAEWFDSRDAGNADADATPVPLGTLIRERFELQAVIGGGSTGVVYRALDRLHLEMDDRDPYVAIKILRDEFKTYPNALMTLQREVRKAQTLAHENIIAVHSFEREGELVYMTMELLDGQPLRELIAGHKQGLPAEQVVPMVVGMARALAYAHDNDIVHSDFSPGNVFLTARGQIKVLDFGVARGAPKPARLVQNQNEPGDEARRTREKSRDEAPDETRDHNYFEGARGMTPAYASPQMLAGQEPAPSDDVFALAIVAYELLTGRHPFDRLPVDETLPNPLKRLSFAGLTRSQHKALTRAFSPQRESRHADAREFLEEFARTKVRKLVTVGIITASALTVLAVAALRDGVQLEDLSVTDRQAFDRAIDSGEQLLGFRNEASLNEAFQSFSQAYEILPHERAEAGLEAVAERWVALLPGGGQDAREGVCRLLSTHAHLATYAPVVESCDRSLPANAPK